MSSSRSQAANCVDSAAGFNLNVSLFPATDQFQARKVAAELHLDQVAFDYVEHNSPRPLRDSQLGCFLSHYRLWNKCIQLQEPLIVFEHDAVVTGPMPNFCSPPNSHEIVNLQDSVWNNPTWPYYKNVSLKLLDPEAKRPTDSDVFVDARYLCLPGTCAYWVSPGAAVILVEEAKQNGPLPADLFINKSLVFISDAVPFPVAPRHNESTVAPNADWSQYQRP